MSACLEEPIAQSINSWKVSFPASSFSFYAVLPALVQSSSLDAVALCLFFSYVVSDNCHGPVILSHLDR